MDLALGFAAMVTVASRPPPRPYVDFAHVPPSQWSMHDRLTNWARWCRSREHVAVAPGFGLFRSSDARTVRQYGAETSVPVDRDDAVRVAKGVAALPDKHRRALNWYYLASGRHPSGAARELGLTLAGLAEMVGNARMMLVNRRV